MFSLKLAQLLSRRFSKMSSAVPAMHDIKTFVFLDLETTGLPQWDNNSTKITELSAIAVEAEHISLGCFPFPRVTNKLSLCFNPCKYIDQGSEKITGLSNELLKNQSKFTANTVLAISNFLEMNRRPICLVAHNGKKFDFPILQAEIYKTQSALSDDILCLDSIVAFRELDDLATKNVEQEEAANSVASDSNRQSKVPFEFDDGFDELLVKCVEEYEESCNGEPPKKKMSLEEIQRKNETTPRKNTVGKHSTENVGRVLGINKLNGNETPKTRNGTRPVNLRSLFTERKQSYRLRDIFFRLTNKPPVLEHQAEGDVIMLITCASVYAERFVDYANATAERFNDVPRMRPGHYIGT